jgi:hypothetical protein
VTDVDSPLPFEASEPNAKKWTDAAYEALTAGTLGAEVTRREGVLASHVSGLCPRCEHQISDDQVLTVVSEGIRHSRESEKADRYVPVTVTCDCGEEHPARPTAAHGCGITFRLELLRPE